MSVDDVRRSAERLGRSLNRLGITMDLAPVADVSSQPRDDVIGDRSFSDDPATVGRYAGAFATGLLAGGVTPVLKHFPGHGRASGDSHLQVVTTPPLSSMRRSDLVPYRTLLGDGAAVMVGHVDVPGLTEPGVPASLSPAALRLLRDDLGFDGLVITDDLGGMAAVTSRFDLPDAATRAIAAGVDMVLWNSSSRLPEVVDHLEAAVASGMLPESRVNESVLRILAAKGVDPCSLRVP
jgi:beta-N-acetylhexosaminidase